MNIDFSVVNNSVVDEPEGELDTQEKLDSMYYNLKRLGRTKNFNQNIQVNYKIPIIIITPPIVGVPDFFTM